MGPGGELFYVNLFAGTVRDGSSISLKIKISRLSPWLLLTEQPDLPLSPYSLTALPRRMRIQGTPSSLLGIWMGTDNSMTLRSPNQGIPIQALACSRSP